MELGLKSVINHQRNRCAPTQQIKQHRIRSNYIDCSTGGKSTGIGIADLSWDAGEAKEPETTLIFQSIVNGLWKILSPTLRDQHHPSKWPCWDFREYHYQWRLLRHCYWESV
jgi:hypothetical protein